jgi:small subunit ribosomal protein S3
LGHKVHPTGFRLGVIKGWQSRWFAERTYKDLLAEDLRLRALVQRRLANAAVSQVEIERAAANQVSVTIHTAKPGIVIGKSGQAVEDLRRLFERETKKKVRLNIIEIRQPEIDAYLVAKNVAEQLEKRVSFRRAMKQAVQKAMRAGAKGIRITVGGRLGGAEIARSEKEMEGKIPLHTLRADIDYGFAEAHTTYGVIGIKVWVYRGDVLPDRRRIEPATPEGQEILPGQGAPTGERAPRPPRRGGGRGGDRPAGGDRGRRRPEGGEQGGGRPTGERPPRPPRAGGERGPRQGGATGSRPGGGGRPGPRGSGSRPRPAPQAPEQRPEGAVRQETNPPAAAVPTPAPSEPASAPLMTETTPEAAPPPSVPPATSEVPGEPTEGERDR